MDYQPQKSFDLKSLINFFCIIFYGIFGTLFVAYESDSRFYNDCGNQVLLGWTICASVFCIICAIQHIFELFLKVYQLDEFDTKYAIPIGIIETINTILLIVCVIGLSAVNDGSCGSLHTLVKVFYIISYVVFGSFGLLFCCACILVKDAIFPPREKKNPLLKNIGFKI